MTERSILIHASTDAIYRLVADPIRMADWSPECVRCRWVGDDQAGRRRRPLPRHQPQRLAPVDDDVHDRRHA